MGAGGDFRHHAAEGRVLADLAEDDIGQNLRPAVVGAFDHRGGGFVAGGFDAEHEEGLRFGRGCLGLGGLLAAPCNRQPTRHTPCLMFQT